MIRTTVSPLTTSVVVMAQCSLTKLMVSHDLLRSTVTNQIAFDQQDLNSTREFERAMDRRCQGLVPNWKP